MSSKMATPGLLKTKVFWNKDYDVLIHAHDVTNKNLSRDSHYVLDLLCDQSLVTSIAMGELSQSQFCKDLIRKTGLFERWSWFKFNNLGLALGMNLKFYSSVKKGLKLIVRKFLGLVSTFIEVTGEKLVGGLFGPPAHPN